MRQGLASRAVPILALAIALGGGAGRVGLADEVRGYVELTARDDDRSREITGDSRVETETEVLFQRFNLVLDRRLFPNVRMRTGGFFERRASTLINDTSETDSTLVKLRPYFNLTLRTPLHVAELRYDRSEDRLDIDGSPSSTEVRETYSASLGYFPDALPQVRLDYFGSRAFDENRLFRDTSEDRLQLTSEYEPLQQLRLTYRGTLADRADKIDENEVRESNHTATVSHSDTFWQRRVRVNSDYRVNYRSTETTTSGTGSVRSSVPRLSGFSSLDDDPEMGLLDPNPALVDANVNVSAGLNLGLPGIGADDRPRNLGVDLGIENELNTLLVWVDLDLPPDIAAAFAWDVYVSEDRDDWVFHQRVSFAEFGPFLRRFEVGFANVTTRYVKLVVSPLTAAVPFAADYPNILVTELQAELIRQADEVERKSSGTSQILNVDFRTRIAESPSVYHELTYFLTKNPDRPTSYTLSNGLSLNHRINRVYTVTSRVVQELDRVDNKSRNSLLYSASLSASAIDTLRQRLVVSGRDQGGDDSRKNYSVFLSNIIRLYRGVDLSVNVGKSAAELSSGQTSEGDEINASATLVPHRKMTINLSYRDREDETSGGGLPDKRTDFAESGQLSVAYNPFATLYLFGSQRVERRTDVPRRTFSSYSVNWTPFPDGTLQFGFRYSETLRSEDDAEERTVSPRLRWNFARGSFLDLAYQRLTTRAVSQRLDNDVFSGTLRFAF